MNERERAPQPEPTRRAPQAAQPPVPAPHAAYAPILRLQGLAGNRAVSALLRSGAPDGGAASPAPDPSQLVTDALASPGRPLPAADRAAMETFLGHDLGHVRLHTDPVAAASADAVNASAYTVGSDIVFGRAGGDRALLAHELTHVVQGSPGTAPTGSSSVSRSVSVSRHDDPEEVQARAVADAFVRGQPAPLAGAVRRPGAAPVLRNENDGGPVDAGVPLPAGVPEPASEPPIEIGLLTDDMLGPVADPANPDTTPARRAEAEEEIARRTDELSDRLGTGLNALAGSAPSTPGGTKVSPEVALAILDNVSRGEPPFRPELGKGGCSWFVTEGAPYTGIDAAKNVPVQVDIAEVPGKVVFREADLVRLLAEEAAATAAEAEAKYRGNFGIPKEQKLSNRVSKAMTRFARSFAESRMWDRVGQTVAASGPKVGEVVLEPGSAFSKTPGKFTVVADPAKIKLRGGPGPLVDAVAAAGTQVEAPLREAAEKLAARQKWAGRVRAVFRHGGRVLIVVGVTQDLIKIYRAEDKVKAVITSVGGWAGATAAGAAFAAWWTPADVAGPWAWVGHGVGTLVSGAIGYWVGSEVTRTIYELTVE